MSQSGILKVNDSILPPDVATTYVCDVGFAVPVANTLDVFGSGGTTTSGAGNVITINSVNTPLTFSANSGSATPIADNINIFGSTVAPGTSPVSSSASGSTVTLNVQRSQAIGASDATKVGLAAFNSAQFTVNANGFVSTSGSGVGNTITGNSGGALSPSSGNWNILGTGSITTVGSGSTLTIELTSLTNHSVLVGAGTPTITSLAVGANGTLLAGNTGADPAFSANPYVSTFGIGAAPTTANLYINNTNRIGAWITGPNISSGSDADGLFIDTSFQPSASITNAASIGLYPTFAPPLGVTISTGYGLYIASGTQAGAGSVTTGYGLFVTHPTFGTTNYAAQIDNIRIDVNTIAATNANGTLDVNSAGIGTLSLGTNATAHATILGSTTASATTTIQGPSGGVFATGVAGTSVSNLNLVTINTSTGQLGSQASFSMSWTDVTGATQTLAANNGYITDRGGGVSYSLPTTAAIGDTFIILGKLGLATITQAASQQILIGSSSSTSGATGTCVSNNVGDSITLTCITANNIFRASSVVGTWTLN